LRIWTRALAEHVRPPRSAAARAVRQRLAQQSRRPRPARLRA
jgi:hypothetical protein